MPVPVRAPSAARTAFTLALVVVALVASTLGASPARALSIGFVRVATGLTRPVYLTHEGNSSGRRFIVEQDGRIRILLASGTLRSTPFLDIRSLVLSPADGGGLEQGLLGLAFHPDYSKSGTNGYRRFYVDYINNSGDTVIAEFHRSATSVYAADLSTRRTVLTVDQPANNHNGGQLAFGPDRNLYIGMGDGGSSDDPWNNAENVNSLLGKILRINPVANCSGCYSIPTSNPYVGRTGRDEIWSIGLRNPWRFSFDRSDGDLFIGDVGQNVREEVDRAHSDSSGLRAGRGVHWGWDTLEGTLCHEPSSGCNRTGKRMPLAEYSHAVSGEDNCSVTGGYVYRGPSYPAMRGLYFFGDWCSGRVWTVGASQPQPQSEVLRANTGYSITSFGEDYAGDLYLVHGGGSVYRVTGS